ncbi:membralin-like protein At1g60995 [Corylus avellana]|uniref:membralin-like protein At1g60995 n=1 Tax=Corylus avellana TaxID=13451 RepID=UPI00286B11E8|nr:membralin-like protein At1g60995 [Corylus avellana]
MQVVRSFWKLWNLAGIHLNIDIPKWLHILHLDRLNSYAVQLLENRSKAFEPTYIYTMEKGYFLLPEGAKSRHNICTVNISISARHSCFGNSLYLPNKTLPLSGWFELSLEVTIFLKNLFFQ